MKKYSPDYWILDDAQATPVGDYERNRLLAEAGKSNIPLKHIYPKDLRVDQGENKLLFRDTPIALPEAVITRFMTGSSFHFISIIRFLRYQGVRLINDDQAIQRAKDKYRSYQIWRKCDFPIIPTFTLSEAPSEKQFNLFSSELGLPFVLKMNGGYRGMGVYLIRQLKDFLDLKDAFGSEVEAIAQKFISESEGEDFKVMVIDGEAVAAVHRKNEKDFRSAVAHGGNATLAVLSSGLKSLAENAARSLGLSTAGVDIIKSRSGFLLIEANSTPGFKIIEDTHSNINVAGKILESLVKPSQIELEEMDIQSSSKLFSNACHDTHKFKS